MTTSCSSGSSTGSTGSPVLVHCASGYRLSAAASLLASRGFPDVSDLLGGYGAWTEALQSVAP